MIQETWQLIAFAFIPLVFLFGVFIYPVWCMYRIDMKNMRIRELELLKEISKEGKK